MRDFKLVADLPVILFWKFKAIPRKLKLCLISDGSRCLEERDRAMVAGNESGIPVFIPSCNENGGYKQVQCHEGKTILENI